MKIIDNKRLDRLLSRSLSDKSSCPSVVSQLLMMRVPFHYGGMSDPFMSYELIGKKTFETLEVLKEFNYPTIISTKGTIIYSPKYLHLLSKCLVTIQFSFSSLNDRISKQLEYNTPTPSDRLRYLKELSSFCFTSARLQPLIPGNIESNIEEMHKLAEAGVRHISVEFLKLPLVGSDKLKAQISKVFGFNIEKFYTEQRIMGLEYLVNRDYAIKSHIRLAEIANKIGIQYSSADTDLLPYDSSDCCCSGVHNVEGFKNYYKHTFSQSIRNALNEGTNNLEYRHLSNEWAPSGPINIYLNSKTRVPGINSIKEWMAYKWNHSIRGIGPLSFYGITDTNRVDENGMKIFSINDNAIDLARKLGFYKNGKG